MPLIRLARYIFSICANSASCERLFSAFGNILTRVRNRLGKDTLQTLAEVKMHIRDEHLSHSDMKNRLKRRFETVDMSQHGGPSHSSPVYPSNAPQADSTSPVPYGPSDTHLNPEGPGHTADSRGEDGQASDQPAPLLSTIINQFMQQGEMDGVESDPPTVEQPAKISLEDLFNFSRIDWVPHHQRTGKRSLDDELGVYSMLDADIPGEEGTEVVVDDMAGDILTFDA